MPWVSVIIPLHNSERYTAESVRSVLNQTYSDKEVIVVDDGSTDRSPEIVASFEPSVRYVRQDNGGAAKARNRGVALAAGEYVAFLDCDDVWLADKLEAQLAVMDRRPEVGVVHTDYESVDEDGRVLERIRARYSPEPLARAFVGGHSALPSTLLMKRSCLDQAGALNPDLYGSEDSDLRIRLYRVTQFDSVDRVLVRKLQRGHGYRDMAFDEAAHREKILIGRERFLHSLEAMHPLTDAQRTALDREWANYFLVRGGAAADRAGRRADARRYYRQAIQKAPHRLRPYTRWLRTLAPWA